MARRGLIAKEFVAAFLSQSSVYPIGSFVELSDQRIAQVVHSNENVIDKPIVTVVSDSQKKLLSPRELYLVDFSQSNIHLRIVRPLPHNCFENIEILYGF
jgi:hypothetical protein